MIEDKGMPSKDGDKIRINSIVMNKKDKDENRKMAFAIVTEVVTDNEYWQWYRLHNWHGEINGKFLMLLVTNATDKQLQEVRDDTFLQD